MKGKSPSFENGKSDQSWPVKRRGDSNQLIGAWRQARLNSQKVEQVNRKKL